MIPPAWREADSATGPVAQGGTGHETSDLGGAGLTGRNGGHPALDDAGFGNGEWVAP
jgi:hypothetical protein